MRASESASDAGKRPAITDGGQASALRLGLVYLAVAAAGRLLLTPVAGGMPLLAPELGIALGLLASRDRPRLADGVALLLAELSLLPTSPGPAPPSALMLALLRALVPPAVHLALGRLGIGLPMNGSIRGYLAFVAVAGLAPGLCAALLVPAGGGSADGALAAGLAVGAGTVLCAPPAAAASALRKRLSGVSPAAPEGLFLALGIACTAWLLFPRSALLPGVVGLVLLWTAIRHGFLVTSLVAAGLWSGTLALGLQSLVPAATSRLAEVPTELLAAERDLALVAVMACVLAVALEQERRLTAWALARARELEALVRALPDLVLRLDADGRILDYRAGIPDDSRVDPTVFLGRPILDLLPAPVASLFAQAMERARIAPEPVQFEYALDAAPGERRHFEARMSALGDGRLLVVVRDITERARAEAELRAHARALARSNAELQQFAYIASHDLQEPLRTVAGFCELLQRRYGDRLDDTGREFVAFAVDGARRMQSLVRDLLDLSRVATRGRPFEPVDCRVVLERVLADLRGALAGSGGTVEVGELPVVRADGSQLGQLFANLLGNALKYRGEEPPRVRVRAERSGDGYLFHVEDNGIGVPPEFHEQIFEPFRRLHSRDEYPGNGIGLAICRKIVDRHGGWIGVVSTPGRGSDFRFWLPDEPAGAVGCEPAPAGAHDGDEGPVPSGAKDRPARQTEPAGVGSAAPSAPANVPGARVPAVGMHRRSDVEDPGAAS